MNGINYIQSKYYSYIVITVNVKGLIHLTNCIRLRSLSMPDARLNEDLLNTQVHVKLEAILKFPPPPLPPPPPSFYTKGAVGEL